MDQLSLLNPHTADVGVQTVVTDFPDADLIENLNHNIRTNVPDLPITAQGYTWGTKTADLGQFDTILAADLVFSA